MISSARMLLIMFASGALSLARGADASSSVPSSESPSASSSDSASSSSDQPSTYKVEKGDTLASVAHQFHCTTAALRKLNGLKHSHLKTGLVLDIPPRHHSVASDDATAKHKKSSKHLAADKSTKTTRHHHLLAAQPVQDFDVPPSTFASCPVPAPNDDESMPVTVIPDGTQVTSSMPSGPTSTSSDFPPSLVANNRHASLLPVPNVAPAAPRSEEDNSTSTSFSAQQKAAPSVAARQPSSPVLKPPAPQRSGFASAIANFFGGSHTSESGEWGNRFLSAARDLAARAVGYDESFRPEGESHSWDMDCSNTTRYLYRVTAGIQLPRTASDQYYYLHLQDKAWDVPMTAKGFADCNFLRDNLKPGDLLFWENTYRPERQPPITHVMIFLGSDSHGHWLMAGSQNGHHGFYNPARTGPDVYVFDPTHYAGGYTTWLGLVHHHGRFVAYGRPLEADAKKLSVAADD
jgi:cell wall-associated NlpC family hydrolase